MTDTFCTRVAMLRYFIKHRKMADVKRRCDLELVSDSFSRCLKDDRDILIDPFLVGYDELCRLFPLLGTVFGFVAKDVSDKLSIMHQHRQSNTGPHYITVDSMVDFETTSGLTTTTGGGPSGSRTLLRLHRALQFIMAFLRGVRSLKSDEKLSGIAAEAYNSTLAAYHGWFVRQGVQLAMYTLPTKHELAIRMGLKNEDEYNKILDQLCDNTQPVYDKIQTIFTEYNVLDLP